MKLFDVCREVGIVEEKLMYGEISFCYDSLMSAMKPGHPADLLDDVLSEIGWDVFAGKPVELDRVKAWIKDLQAFKRAFKVKELSKAIKMAQEYVKEQEGSDHAG